jgi:hypothetical protein
MPPKETKITNLKNFRGNILDRQFPVQFDPTTGMYSYDYVKVTPEIEAKLKSLQYFRKSSKSLAEIEADLAAYLAKEGPPVPGAKGEITKAAEEETKKIEEAGRVVAELSAKQASGQPLSPYEQKLAQNTGAESLKLLRPKKVEYAKKQQEAMFTAYNEKVTRGEPVNINANTKRPKLSAANQASFNSFSQIIDAAKYLDDLETKEKSGVALTPGEQAEKTQKALVIDTFALPATEMQAIVTLSTNINDKGKYNSAKARYTQLKNIPTEKLTLGQRQELASSVETMMGYERAHPEVATKATEQRTLQQIELMRKNIKAINTKPQPLSPEDQATKTRLEGIVAAYNATHARNLTTYNAENTALEKNELEKLASSTRELSDTAFQARRGKAQKVLNYFTGPTAPALLTKELTNLRNTAQKVKNAFAKLNNATAKKTNKNTARNTISKSNFMNKARALSVPTEGGKQRTRKVRHND